MTRAPLPLFSHEDAVKKLRMAEDAWNTGDPVKVSLAYTPDTKWRNRSEFLSGRGAVEAFLTTKWQRELDYRLIKEIWAFDTARIALRFCYEYHTASGSWFRAYGNENREFDAIGYMALRHASINDVPVAEADRKFHWPSGPRPPEHPGLADLGL